MFENFLGAFFDPPAAVCDFIHNPTSCKISKKYLIFNDKKIRKKKKKKQNTCRSHALY